MEQAGEDEAVLRGERGLGALALQDRELVSQHRDLDLHLALGHRQQTYERERVRDGEAGQKQQHSRSSSQRAPSRRIAAQEIADHASDQPGRMTFRHPQRLRDSSDLRDPAVTAEPKTYLPWYEQASARLEIYHRVVLWRALTGDDTFDIVTHEAAVLVLYLSTSALYSEV
ncbi:hypothetical protein [Streptomyces sp. NPDC059262]|uniref:hypothetical protein n=1 Tax=Streptomyces sp. NPDC059262 TaxID=3346797 RepID=UPI0036B6E80A